MPTLYLGNRGDDVRDYSDEDVILLAPSANAIGGVTLKKDKDAYLANAWDGLKHSSKYFYFREKKRKSKAKPVAESVTDVFDSPQAALDAARAWMEANNTNNKNTVIEIKAADMNEEIAKRFFFVEGKIDYPEKQVPLDPRFLGMWLGDGTSSSTEITTIDQPIKDYINKLSEEVKCKVTLSKKKVPGHCIVHKKGSNNQVRDVLRELNLFDNKHIPDIYMQNSVKVRTELLAGLLDTDGYLQNNVYEFIQKRQGLAEQTMILARSLGIYSTCVEKQARATNSNNPEYGTYHRVFIHMTPRAPDLGLLLERKQWKANQDERGDYSITIALKQTQESFRHEWTDTLVAKLKDVIPKYTTQFGQVQWKVLQESETDFADFTPDAIRATYTQLRKKEAKSDTSSSASGSIAGDRIQMVKEQFIKNVGHYQTENGKIKWDELLASDEIFAGMTVQNMRTIMTKLTDAEKTTIENNKKAFDNKVRAMLTDVVGKYKNARGGVAWETMIADTPLFQQVGISLLKKMYVKMTDLKEASSEAQDNRKALAERLKVLVQDPRYLLSTGKIKWKQLVDTEPMFAGLNPDVLRVMYKSF
jgi:hypothetical protein